MLVICSLERKKECKFENSIVTSYYKPMCFYHVFIIWSVVCVSKRNNFTMFFIIWSVVCVNKRRKLWWNMVENLGQSWNHSIEHKRLNMMMIEGNKLHAYLVICNRPNYIAPKAMHSHSLTNPLHKRSCRWSTSQVLWITWWVGLFVESSLQRGLIVKAKNLHIVVVHCSNFEVLWSGQSERAPHHQQTTILHDGWWYLERKTLLHGIPIP